MIAIIGAMDEEVAYLKTQLTDVQTHSIAGFDYHLGKLEGRSVVLNRCGIGKVNAAIGCTLLLDKFKPNWVLNSGSAGGLLASQTFGDIVVSNSVLYHDADVTAFGYEKGQIPHLPAVFQADEALVAKAEKAIDALKTAGKLPKNLGHTRGVLGSGDVFVHEAKRIASLRQDFPSLCAVDMESASIGHTCYVFKTPFVILRALSDIAGKESPMKFEEFLPIASEHSAQLVIEIIKNLR